MYIIFTLIFRISSRTSMILVFWWQNKTLLFHVKNLIFHDFFYTKTFSWLQCHGCMHRNLFLVENASNSCYLRNVTKQDSCFVTFLNMSHLKQCLWLKMVQHSAVNIRTHHGLKETIISMSRFNILLKSLVLSHLIFSKSWQKAKQGKPFVISCYYDSN